MRGRCHSSWSAWPVWLVVMSACGGVTDGTLQQTGPSVDEVKRAEAVFGARLESDEDVDWTSEEVEAEVMQLLRLYAAYANRHHGDSLAGAMLMRRADLLQGRGDVEEAIRQWVDVVEGYPKDPMAPEAMFRIGFARETALRDTTEAVKVYSELARVYPESAWAEQALSSVKWLSFSEEQWLRSLSNQP